MNPNLPQLHRLSLRQALQDRQYLFPTEIIQAIFLPFLLITFCLHKCSHPWQYFFDSSGDSCFAVITDFQLHSLEAKDAALNVMQGRVCKVCTKQRGSIRVSSIILIRQTEEGWHEGRYCIITCLLLVGLVVQDYQCPF